MEKILTVTDVMSQCGVGRVTATRWIKQSGRAINQKKGQKLLITQAALDEYLRGEI